MHSSRIGLGVCYIGSWGVVVVMCAWVCVCGVGGAGEDRERQSGKVLEREEEEGSIALPTTSHGIPQDSAPEEEAGQEGQAKPPSSQVVCVQVGHRHPVRPALPRRPPCCCPPAGGAR